MDTSAPLLTITYASSAADLMSVDALVQLIEEIRPRNESLDITGLLLYSGGSIVQTLEGRPFEVEMVFADISADPRHTHVRVLERRDIEERAFSTWAMGFRNVTAREVAELQDFGAFARESVGYDLDTHASAAFDLLSTFRVSSTG